MMKIKLRGERFGAFDCSLAWYPARPLHPTFARVVKLVDTGDLKSPGHCGRAGSSPAPGTTRILIKTYSYISYDARSIDSGLLLFFS